MVRAELYLRTKFVIYILIPFALYLVPTEGIYHGHSLCLSILLFDRECPGCGITRAVFSILYGDVQAAFAFNKMVLGAFPTLVAMWFRDLRLMYDEIRARKLFLSYSALRYVGPGLFNHKG